MAATVPTVGRSTPPVPPARSEKPETPEAPEPSIKDRLVHLLTPSTDVSPDYTEYRKAHAVEQFASSALSFIGTQGLVLGLAAAMGAHIPLLAAVGATAFVAYNAKTALNFIGTIVGGQLAHKVDADPKGWLQKGEVLKVAGNGMQAALMAMPGLYWVVAPIASAVNATGTTLQSAAGTDIDRHTAVSENQGEVNSKNQIQDLLTGIAGGAVGAALAFFVVPHVGAAALVVAVPALALASILANRKSAHALDLAQEGAAA